MKNLLIAVFVALVSVQLFAQDIPYGQTGGHTRNLFYADVVSKIANLNGNWGLFGGMRAGYNIDENISVGAIAHGLIPNRIDKSYINQNGRDQLHLGYGGAEVSYKYDVSDIFNVMGSMMIGAGRADYEVQSGDDYFFIMEPGASVNYKLTDWFGLGYTVNYRLASGVHYGDFSNASFSGWGMDLSFKFGF